LKKKHFVIIFMSLFFLAAGAFHYDGSENHAEATKDPVNTVNEKAKVGEVTETNQIEPVDLSTSDAVTEVPENLSDPLPEKTDEQAMVGKENPVSVNEEGTSEDTITIGESVYHLVMDEKKYPNLADRIRVVREYGSKLYGIPNSDVFAVIKDGKPIMHMSTGVAKAPAEHAHLLKEDTTGYYPGIAENIDFVVKTGAKVSVEFGSTGEAYTVYKDEKGWITLSW